MEKSKDRLAIHQWAAEDRPREKLLLKGRASLSDAELIGILLGSGTRTMSAVDLARMILTRVDNDLNQLARLTVPDLMKFPGIGEAKAISIVSALELGRRRKTEKPERVTLNTPRQIYEYMHPDLHDLPHEEFWIIFLKKGCHVIRKERISQGGVDRTVVDPRIIFRLALEYRATSIVAVHNHPSQQTEPSRQDIHLTEELKNAGQVLHIRLMDHLIYGDEGFYSFADKGQLT